MDVPSLMRQSARCHARRTAVITRDRVLTFAEAWDRGVRVANGLRALGVQAGDRVAGVEDNTLGAADLFLGAAIAGAVRVPLYPRNSRQSHRVMIEQTGAVVVIAEAAYADAVKDLDQEIGSLRHVVVRDHSYEDWLVAQSDVDPLVAVAPQDWYIVRHSSGTTGRPKGVGYTQHDWLVNCRNWFYRLPRLSWDSVVGHAAPISHAAGYLFLPAWLAGATNLGSNRQGGLLDDDGHVRRPRHLVEDGGHSTARRVPEDLVHDPTQASAGRSQRSAAAPRPRYRGLRTSDASADPRPWAA